MYSLSATYFLSGDPLDAVPTVKDIGVYLSTDMKSSVHCTHRASKACHGCTIGFHTTIFQPYLLHIRSLLDMHLNPVLKYGTHNF